MPLTDLAESYAALRHPALVPVQPDEAIGWVTQSSVPGTPPTAMPAAQAAQAAGELALGLAALHNLGLMHGPIGHADIRELDDHFVLAGVAQPITPSGAKADLQELAIALRGLAEPGTAELDQLFDSAAKTTDATTWGRSALATAAELGNPTEIPAIATKPEPASRLGADPDTARRRTRNRMIIVGTVVIILGAIVLKQIDNHGIVKVTNVVGDSERTAVADLNGIGLRPIVHGGAGTVVSESPKAGTDVRPGRTIILDVGQPQPDTVPSNEGPAQ